MLPASGRLIPLLPALVLACAGEDAGAPGPATLSIAKPATGSGDEQVGIAGRPLAEELRVVVSRGDEPAAGVAVTWSTSEGSLEVPSSRTDADGVSRARWTLQHLFAQQIATAGIAGQGGTATVIFSAMAGPDPEAWNTVHVLNDGNRFEPAEIRILVGDTVNWYWPPGAAGHNIVPDDGDLPPHSGAPDAYPRSHSFRFTAPGVHRYYCMTHGAPGGVGMSGTITVLDREPELGPLTR